MHRSLILSALAAFVTLSGCATQISAPSLAPRAVEKQPINLPVSDPIEIETPVAPALAEAIASIVATAEAGDKAFQQQRERAISTVSRAAGSPQGSETWIAAQEALTALDAARGPIGDAARAIDTLRQDPANAATGDRAAIDQAAARIEALDAAERAASTELAARLR